MAKSDKPKKKQAVTRTRVVTAKDDSAAAPSPKKRSKKSVSETTAKKDVSKKSKTPSAANKTKPAKKGNKYNILSKLWGYLKGSWYELTQVRWPNRRETWGMTIAVIIFSAFFVALILGLDAIYKYLFDFILEG